MSGCNYFFPAIVYTYLTTATMDYTLSDSYVSGGIEVPAFINNFANKWVGGYPVIALAVIIVLLILVIYCYVWKAEHMNPTQTLMFQSQDQNNVGRHKESLDNPDPRAQSVFAQTTQSTTPGGTFTVDPTAAANAPGSLGYQILNSPDFHCDTRTPVGSDAWSWMNTQLNAPESMGNPKTDNTFSKILAGH